MASRTEPKLPRPIEYTDKRKINRSRELRRDNDDYKKNYSITLMDHDHAVMYYFNEVIKPTVKEANEIIKVPVYYGNEERWRNFRKRGVLRDKNGSLILPLIMLRRTDVSFDDAMKIWRGYFDA